MSINNIDAEMFALTYKVQTSNLTRADMSVVLYQRMVWRKLGRLGIRRI